MNYGSSLGGEIGFSITFSIVFFFVGDFLGFGDAFSIGDFGLLGCLRFLRRFLYSSLGISFSSMNGFSGVFFCRPRKLSPYGSKVAVLYSPPISSNRFLFLRLELSFESSNFVFKGSGESYRL